MPEKVARSLIAFVRKVQKSPEVARKPSVRVSIGLYERAQANALLRGREQVEPADVTDAIISVLSHRIELKPSLKYVQTTEEFLAEELKKFQESEDGLNGGGLL